MTIKKTIGIFALITSIQGFANESMKFEDLTGSRFSGSDKDLALVRISGIRVGCNTDIIEPDALVLSWETENLSSETRRLDTYTVNFEIYDRRGKKLNSSQFKWKWESSSGPGLVSKELCWDHRRSIPGNDGVFIKMKAPEYGTIKYWISNITAKPRK